MQNYHLLRRYIREAIDLGQIQFSPSRVGLNVDRTEPNTPEENELYAALDKRINGIKNIDEKTADILSQLIDSEKYGTKGSGFFRGPEPGIQLYRGHAVNQAWVDKHISEAGNIPMNQGRIRTTLINSQEITLKVPHIFTERRGWSKSLKMAAEWATNYATGYENIEGYREPLDPSRTFAVIYIINTNEVPQNAMLDFEHSVYKTSVGHGFANEQEVMNLFPITISKVKIVNAGPS